MCDPATVILVASTAIQIGSAVASHQAQSKQAKANKANALDAMMDTFKDISLQEAQHKEAAAQTLLQADRQAREDEALARVSAGEAGVSGASVDALIGDLAARAGEFKTTQQKNLDWTLSQLDRQRKGAQSTAQSRIAGVPAPSAIGTGLTIAGSGLNAADNLIRRKPSSGK